MVTSDTLRLISKVAYLYFEEGLGQKEIGERLGLSRQTVGRLLQKARDLKIVRISIVSFDDDLSQLERSLEEKLDLREAIVIANTYRNSKQLKGAIGKAGSEYLGRIVKNGSVIGVAWGTTLSEIPRQLWPRRLGEVRVIQLVGSISHRANLNVAPSELVRGIAVALGGQYELFPAPAVVDTREIRDAILSDSRVRRLFRTMEAVDIALLGVGAVGCQSPFVMKGYLSPKQMDRLSEAGAVGEVCGRFFTIDGYQCASELCERMLSIELGSLRRIRTRVGLACGLEKAEAVLGAIKGQLINVLITDEKLAERLLQVSGVNRE